MALWETAAPLLEGIGNWLVGGGDDSALAQAGTTTTTAMPYTARHFPALVESIFIVIVFLDTATKKTSQLVEFLEKNLAMSNPLRVYEQRKEFEELVMRQDNVAGRKDMSKGLGFLLLSNLRLIMYFMVLPMDIGHDSLLDRHTNPWAEIGRSFAYTLSVIFGIIMYILVDRPTTLQCFRACCRPSTDARQMRRFADYFQGNTMPPLLVRVVLGIVDLLWYSGVKWAFSPFVCHYPDGGEDAFMLTIPSVKCWTSGTHWCLLSFGFMGLIGLMSWQLSTVLRKFRGLNPPFEGTYESQVDPGDVIVVEILLSATSPDPEYIRIKEKPKTGAHARRRCGMPRCCRGLLNFGYWYKVDRRIFCDTAGGDETYTCSLTLEPTQACQRVARPAPPREKPQLKVSKSGVLEMVERGHAQPRHTHWRRISYPFVPYLVSPLPLFGVVITKLVGTLMWASFGHRSQEYKWVVVITMSACSLVIAAIMHFSRPYAYDFVNRVVVVGMSAAAATSWLSILVMDESSGYLCRYLFWFISLVVCSSVLFGHRRSLGLYPHLFRVHTDKKPEIRKSLSAIRAAIERIDVDGNGDETPEQVWFPGDAAPVHILDIRGTTSAEALPFKEWIDNNPAEASWLYAPAVDTKAPEFRTLEDTKDHETWVLNVVYLRNPMSGILRPRFLQRSTRRSHSQGSGTRQATTKRYDMETHIFEFQWPADGHPDKFQAGRCLSVYFECQGEDARPLSISREAPPAGAELPAGAERQPLDQPLQLCIREGGRAASAGGCAVRGVCRVYERNGVMYQTEHYEQEGGEWNTIGEDRPAFAKASAPGHELEFEIKLHESEDGVPRWLAKGCRVCVCKTSITASDVKQFASDCNLLLRGEVGECSYGWPFWQRLQDVDMETRRVIALGVAGAGKSTLMSALCGYTSGNLWHAMGGASAGGVTKKIRGTVAEEGEEGGHPPGATLYIDIPGVQEGHLGVEDSATHAEDMRRLDESISRLRTDGEHADGGPFLDPFLDHFLLVVHAADARRPQRLERSLTTLHRYFGPEIASRITVVFTNFSSEGRRPDEISLYQRSCITEFSKIFVGVFDSAPPLGLHWEVEEAESRHLNHKQIPCFFIDTVAAFPDMTKRYPHSSGRDAQHVLEQIKRRIEKSAIESRTDSSMRFKTSWWPPTITGCMNEEMVLLEDEDVGQYGVDIKLEVKIPREEKWNLCPWHIAPLSRGCEFHLERSRLELPHIPAHSPLVFTLDVFVEWKECRRIGVSNCGPDHRLPPEGGADVQPAENQIELPAQDSGGQQGEQQGEVTFLACGGDGSGEASGCGGYHVTFKSDGDGGGGGIYTFVLFGETVRDDNSSVPGRFEIRRHAHRSGYLTCSFDGVQACLYMENQSLGGPERLPGFRFRHNGHAQGPKGPLRLGAASCFVKDLCIYERALAPEELLRNLHGGTPDQGTSSDGLRINRQGVLEGRPTRVGLQHYKVFARQDGQPRTAEYSLWLGVSPSRNWLEEKFRAQNERRGGCIDLQRENGSLQQPRRYDTIRRVTAIVNDGFGQWKDPAETWDAVYSEVVSTNTQLKLIRENRQMERKVVILEGENCGLQSDLQKEKSKAEEISEWFSLLETMQVAENDGDLARLQAVVGKMSSRNYKASLQKMDKRMRDYMTKEEKRADESLQRWKRLDEKLKACIGRAIEQKDRDTRNKKGYELDYWRRTASLLFDDFAAALDGGLSLQASDRRLLIELLEFGLLERGSNNERCTAQDDLIRKVVHATRKDLGSFNFTDLVNCLEFLDGVAVDRIRKCLSVTSVCDFRQRLGQLKTLQFLYRYINKESPEKAKFEFKRRNPKAPRELLSVIDKYSASRQGFDFDADPAEAFKRMGRRPEFWGPLVNETMREIFCKLAEIWLNDCGIFGVPHHTQIVTILTFCQLLERHGTGAPTQTLIAQVGTGEGKSMLIAVLAVYIVLAKNMRVHVIGGDEKLMLRDFEAFRPLFDYARKKSKTQKPRFAVACATSTQDEGDLVPSIPAEAWIVYCEAKHVMSHYSHTARTSMDFSVYQKTVLIIDEVAELGIDQKPTEHIVYPMGSRSIGEGESVSDCAKALTLDLMDPDRDRSSIPDRNDPRKPIYSQLRRISEAVERWEQKPEAERKTEYIKCGQNHEWTRVEGGKLNKDYESNFLECLRQRHQPADYRMEWYERLFVVSKPRVFGKYRSILGLTGAVDNEGEREFLRDTYRAVFFEVPPFLTTCEGDDNSFHEAMWAGSIGPRYMHSPLEKPAVVESNRAGQFEAIELLAFAASALVPVLVITRSSQEADDLVDALRMHFNRFGGYHGMSTLAEQRKDHVRLLSQSLYENRHQEYKDNLNAATRPIVSSHHDGKERYWRITVTDPTGGRGNDYQMADEGVDERGGLMVIMSHIPPSRRDWVQFKGRTARQRWKGQYCAVLNAEEQEGMEEGQLQGEFYVHGPSPPKSRCKLSEAVASHSGRRWRWVPDSPDDLVVHIHDVCSRDSKRRIDQCVGVHKAGFLVNEVCEEVWRTAAGGGAGQGKHKDLSLDPERRARFMGLCSRYARMSARTIEAEARHILKDRADYALPRWPRGIAEYEPPATARPKALIFILDVSMSMDTGVGEGGATRLDVCKNRMASLLTNEDIVTERDRIGVVAFSNQHEFVADLAPATAEHRANVRSLASESTLNTIAWRGGTHLYEALLHYSQKLCTSLEFAELEKWVILLADGEDDSDLVKGQRLDIPQGTEKLEVRGDWSWTKPREPGPEYFLDFSALLYGKNEEYLYSVDPEYNDNAEKDGILHWGDYRTGRDYCQRIAFTLGMLDPKVHEIYLTVSTADEEVKFNDFSNPRLNLTTEDALGTVTAVRSFALGEVAQESLGRTAIIMCRLERTADGAWAVTLLGDFTDGSINKVEQLKSHIRRRRAGYAKESADPPRASCGQFFAHRSKGLNLVSMVVSDVGREATGTLQSFCQSVEAQGGVGLCVQAKDTDAAIQEAFADVQECLMDEGGQVEMY